MTGKVLSFYLGGSLCGIDINLAQEITRNGEYNPVLGTSSPVIGLLNLRGQVVTLLDFGQMLNFKQIDEQNDNHSIILKNSPADPDRVGFFIDKLGEVVDVGPDICEPPPANVCGGERRFISEVVKLNGELLLILDIKQMVGIDDGYGAQIGRERI
jgi:purine-binding chemotaxis protein CheW